MIRGSSDTQGAVEAQCLHCLSDTAATNWVIKLVQCHYGAAISTKTKKFAVDSVFWTSAMWTTSSVVHMLSSWKLALITLCVNAALPFHQLSFSDYWPCLKSLHFCTLEPDPWIYPHSFPWKCHKSVRMFFPLYTALNIQLLFKLQQPGVLTCQNNRMCHISQTPMPVFILSECHKPLTYSHVLRHEETVSNLLTV